jgi:hypothetical protein
MGQTKAQAPASAENDELAKVRNVQDVIDRTSASVGQVCVIILILNHTQYPTSLGIILPIVLAVSRKRRMNSCGVSVILSCCRIRLLTEEGCEAPHNANTIVLRIGWQAAYRHDFEHALPQRIDGMFDR